MSGKYFITLFVIPSNLVHMSRLLAHLQWLFANDHDFSVNISTSDVGIKALRLLEMCGIEIIVAMALQGSVLDKEVKCYSSEASFNSKKFDCERHIYLFDEFAVRDCSNADFAYVSWTSVLKERAGYYDIIIMGADALVACAEALPNRPSGNDHMSKLLKKYGSMQNQKKESPRGFGKLLLDETTRSLEWKCQVEAHETSGEFLNMLPSFLRRFDSLHHGDYLYSIETSIRKLLVEGGSPLKKTDGPDIPKDAILSYLRQSKCPMTLVLSVVPGYQQSKYAANFSHRDIYLDMHLSDAPNYIHSCALAEAVDLWKKLVDVNQGVNRSDYEDAIFLAMENINA